MSAGVVRMPRLSDSMTEATIVAWLKHPGEPFVRGEPLVEVETDKATVVYEAEADGVLAEILVAEGDSAPLGAPIARLEGGDPAAAVGTEAEAESRAASTERAAPATQSAVLGVRALSAETVRHKATPVARKTAAELGIPLQGVAGTGPGGRIRKLDVVRASAPEAGTDNGALKGVTTIVPLSTTGATIARRMAQSRSEIPSFDVAMDVDVSTMVELRRDTVDLIDAAPSLNDFVVKAAGLALREHPAFNSSFIDGRSERHSRVNVGIAVATEEALLVPAILDADRKSVSAIAAESRDLAARARARSVRPDELAASTFTVSNLGMLDVRSFSAVINPPQVAILAVGAVRREAVERETGRVTFRDIVTLTLTSDHRAVYGADAARFLGSVRRLLEHPLALLLERPDQGVGR